MITTSVSPGGLFGGASVGVSGTLGAGRLPAGAGLGGRKAFRPVDPKRDARRRELQTQLDAMRRLELAQRETRAHALAEIKAFANRLNVQSAPRAVALLATLGGSAVAIRPGNLLLTAWHVVEKLTLGHTTLATFGAGPAIRGTLVAVDRDADLALFRLAAAAPFALSPAAANFRPGQSMAYGFPGARLPLRASLAGPCGSTSKALWADAKLSNGQSGGPVIDAVTGDLVGLVSCGRGTVEQFVALDAIRDFLAECGCQQRNEQAA